MTRRDPTRPDRPALLSRVLPRLAALAAAGVVLAMPLALSAGDPAVRGGAGGPMPSFLLPNLLAIAMSLTVLAVACKRFKRE